MTLQLDPITLREATTQAIMGTLTPEIRAQIIEKAISTMLTPSTNSWDRNHSPIQQAFDDAVMHCAREIAKAHVASDEKVKVRLQELMRQAAEKVLGMDADKLAEKMADAFTSSIRRD
jgi:hypothetical protein